MLESFNAQVLRQVMIDARNPYNKLFGEYYTQETCSNGIVGMQVREKNSFEVFLSPNPVSSRLLVTCKDQSDLDLPHVIEIWNSLGNRVSVDIIKGDHLQYEVDVDHLTNGVYFVSVEYEGIQKVLRFVVNH